MSPWISGSNALCPAWINSAGIWSIPGHYIFSAFQQALTSKKYVQVLSCMDFCLP